MADIVEVAYSFPAWADVDDGSGITFEALLKAEAVGMPSPKPLVIFRLATLRDGDHADDVARGGLPDVHYVRALDPEQARAFGAMLIRAADHAAAK